ncbi:MAG: FkbM family methyltransferase [Sphingomonadales bacterium]|nr:FkbM family methyltransferase [Sphingomonadales bacterium]
MAQTIRSQKQVTHTATVKVQTLNDYANFSELGISRPYLKLDTQGFDFEVLMGASSFLPKVCPCLAN